jgi:hypothetical protein
VCCDKILIQGATDLLQQPELCDKFYIMHAIHRPTFIITIGEHFFPVKPIHAQITKFYLIKFEGIVYEIQF